VDGRLSKPFTSLNFVEWVEGENVFSELLELLEDMGFTDEEEKVKVAREVSVKLWGEWKTYPKSWLAKHPSLFNIYMDHLGRWVKRDWLTRKMVFLTGLSAYSPNPINLFLRGPSSIGKTYTALQTLKYFPKKDVWLLGGLSPTALVHDYGKFVNEKGEEIPAVDWRGESRKSEVYYRVDMTNKILVFLEAPHPDTFAKLRPILSHDTLEVSYKFTERTKSGFLRTKHVVIRGWPATIFCTTDPKYTEELATRSITMTPEMSEAKYEAVITHKGRKVAEPWLYENPDPMLFRLKECLNDVKEAMAKFEVAIPYGEELALCYPHTLPRDMRDFDKLTSLIQQCTYLHVYQRPWVEGLQYNQRKIVLSTLKDFHESLELFKNIIETTRLGLPGNVVDFYEKVLVALWEERGLGQSPDEGLSLTEIAEKWFEVYKTTRAKSTLRINYINPLEQAGLVDEVTNPIDRREKLIRVLEKNLGNTLDYFRKQFYGLFKPKRLEEWLKRLLNQNNQIKIKIGEEEIPIEEFSFKYFMEFSQ
jgi:hypothetical protein